MLPALLAPQPVCMRSALLRSLPSACPRVVSTRTNSAYARDLGVHDSARARWHGPPGLRRLSVISVPSGAGVR